MSDRLKIELKANGSSIEMFTLRFDGGCQPNPGEGAGSYWIESPDGKVIEEGGVYLQRCTNNIAEYTGFIEGLYACLRHGLVRIKVEGDSMLVVCQTTGKWKASHPNIIPLWKEAVNVIKLFDSVEISHVLRNKNKKADQLSDLTLEKKVNWKSSF
jgi:probable phosphoglycerate mutase